MSLSSLPKSLELMEAVIADGGKSSVAALARALGLPVATAHRHVTTLVVLGYLTPSSYGRHIAGPRLIALALKIDEKQVIASAAGPVLDRLAAKTGCVAQLGTFENDMVTYRLKAGQSAGELFTKVGMQLEAYCSGIGKVLLAHLPARDQAAYLDTGPFPALTPRTITDPVALKAELETIASQGFALDNEEVAIGVECIAVPVPGKRGVIAAISISRATGSSAWPKRIFPLMRSAAAEIARHV
jgi:IclR family transcriptional regulator, acetate operon repressor